MMMVSTEQEITFRVLARDSCQCQSCGKWPAGLIYENKTKRKGVRDALSDLITLCGRCHMLVSKVPDWIVVRVWKITLSNIPLERKMVQGRIKRKGQLRA
jgi:hypothetical protein